jgi:hypothetical protein
MKRLSQPVPPNGAIVHTRTGGTRFAWLITTGVNVDRAALAGAIGAERDFASECLWAARALMAHRLPTATVSLKQTQSLVKAARRALLKGAASFRITTPKSKALLLVDAIVLNAILTVAAKRRRLAASPPAAGGLTAS